MDERQLGEQREAVANEAPVPSHQVRVQAPTDMAGAPTFYSNMIQVATSPYDFTLHFSWFSTPIFEEPPGEDIKVTARPVATVTIPVALMGNLIEVLQTQFANYQALLRRSIALQEEPSTAQEEVEGQ
jgi:Protein of unknown function (DUF3467)